MTSLCVEFRVRPITGIGYRPILAIIGQYRYRPILIWVSAPIPVVLSFIYLSQQSTLLQRTPIVSSLCRIFMHIPRIHITCTHLYSTQNRIFSTKKFVQPSIVIGMRTAVADSIGYRAPARYRSNPSRVTWVRSTRFVTKNYTRCSCTICIVPYVTYV